MTTTARLTSRAASTSRFVLHTSGSGHLWNTLFQRLSEMEERKCEYQGEVRKQGEGVRRARGNGYATASPLFVYSALFFTLPFQRVVGIPYRTSTMKSPFASSLPMQSHFTYRLAMERGDVSSSLRACCLSASAQLGWQVLTDGHSAHDSKQSEEGSRFRAGPRLNCARCTHK